jgi:hypothetical protein
MNFGRIYKGFLWSLDRIIKILNHSGFVSKISLKIECGLILLKPRVSFVKWYVKYSLDYGLILIILRGLFVK